MSVGGSENFPLKENLRISLRCALLRQRLARHPAGQRSPKTSFSCNHGNVRALIFCASRPLSIVGCTISVENFRCDTFPFYSRTPTFFAKDLHCTYKPLHTPTGLGIYRITKLLFLGHHKDIHILNQT